MRSVIDLLFRGAENNRAQRALPVLLLAGTVVIRIAFAWSAPVARLYPDHQEYEHLARNLVRYHTYGFTPDWRQDAEMAKSPWRSLYDSSGMVRPPGYPFVLAVLAKTVGWNYRAHQAVLAVVEGAMVVVVYFLAKMLFGAVAGMLAAGLCMVNPGMLDYMTKLGREPFLAFFLALSLYLVLRAFRERCGVLASLAGVGFGLGGYFKETVAMAGAVAVVWVFLAGWRTRCPFVRIGALVLAGIVMTVAPWVVRNSAMYGRVVGFTNLSGCAMYLGLVPADWTKRQPAEFQAGLDPSTAQDGVEADRRYKAQVWAYVKDQPAGAVRAMLRNAAYFWLPFPREVWQSGFRSLREVVAAIYYMAAFILAIAGGVMYRRRPEAWLAVLVLLGMTGLHAICVSWPRYRTPFDPIVLIFAAAAITAWMEKRRAPMIAGAAEP